MANLSSSPDSATLLAGARRAREAGDLSAEQRLLERALAAAPTDARVLNAVGMQALAAHDGERARDLFVQASTADPGQPVLLLNVATAQRMIGDTAAERAALDEVLSIDRTNFTAHLRLAELYQRTGDAIAAAQEWSAVVQMASATDPRPPLMVDALERGLALLREQNDGLSRRIDDELGTELGSMGADARRFSACVDHMLGRRPIYHNQCAGIHYPFLPADEFFDRRLFPWFTDLEAQADVIRNEALALLVDNDVQRPYVRQDAGTPTNKWSPLDNNKDWSAAFLWEYGVRDEALCARCPATVAALEAVPQTDIPGKAPTAFFSILRAGAHIPAHTGVTNTRTIIHLPLVVPPACAFRVGGETRPWIEGEAFAFDDTIEHEAWNRSTEPRIVLIFDVWNPHLTTDEQRLLKTMFRITDQGAVKP
ncbi:aspartyl/asparaginyl beta-hydroxylase domain-containing protein [Sphingomonas sp. HHU CXW]|uniref:Aspartyl/asparaginyl beta-hydroxylase domain-containing protein n=2 Tax=Sphingomonas hominis TaxID=2741495 RepID=A0ABX2JP26_9SPHN|nr:aspartyl/asparaginyl beta-hydroxylase domain-containing protein [Sphingomonas hominis]